MDIIKTLLTFDERSNTNLIGGAGASGVKPSASTSTPAPAPSTSTSTSTSAPAPSKPVANPQSKYDEKGGKDGGTGGKDGESSSKDGENDNKSKNEKRNDVNESIGDLYELVKTTIINVYEWLKGGLMNWIVVPIVFGSFAPAMPFMIVMALLFGIMKYFVDIFRKL